MLRTPLRFLIHPDDATYPAIVTALDAAIVDHAENFDRVVGEPATVDHYGFHNGMLSSVVFTSEHNSRFYRLTVRPGLHPVFDALCAIVLAGDATPPRVSRETLSETEITVADGGEASS